MKVRLLPPQPNDSSPIVKYVPQLGPTSTPNPFKEAAFTGILRFSATTKKFYLETASAQAVTLEVPPNVSLKKYLGRRILAVGNLNTQTGILTVVEASDLELLPTQAIPIPTTPPTPTPTLTPTPSPTIPPSP